MVCAVKDELTRVASVACESFQPFYLIVSIVSGMSFRASDARWTKISDVADRIDDGGHSFQSCLSDQSFGPAWSLWADASVLSDISSDSFCSIHSCLSRLSFLSIHARIAVQAWQSRISRQSNESVFSPHAG